MLVGKLQRSVVQHVLVVEARVASHSLPVPAAAQPYCVTPAANVSTKSPVALRATDASVFFIFFNTIYI